MNLIPFVLLAATAHAAAPKVLPPAVVAAFRQTVVGIPRLSAALSPAAPSASPLTGSFTADPVTVIEDFNRMLPRQASALAAMRERPVALPDPASDRFMMSTLDPIPEGPSQERIAGALEPLRAADAALAKPDADPAKVVATLYGDTGVLRAPNDSPGAFGLSLPGPGDVANVELEQAIRAQWNNKSWSWVRSQLAGLHDGTPGSVTSYHATKTRVLQDLMAMQPTPPGPISDLNVAQIADIASRFPKKEDAEAAVAMYVERGRDSLSWRQVKTLIGNDSKGAGVVAAWLPRFLAPNRESWLESDSKDIAEAVDRMGDSDESMRQLVRIMSHLKTGHWAVLEPLLRALPIGNPERSSTQDKFITRWVKGLPSSGIPSVDEVHAVAEAGSRVLAARDGNALIESYFDARYKRISRDQMNVLIARLRSNGRDGTDREAFKRRMLAKYRGE